ncbi:MAG: hypothetical protein HOP15_03445 [Planctomycetes bacterium]|nr:hypothetical protein [Planctomycetota bacterium]
MPRSLRTLLGALACALLLPAWLLPGCQGSGSSSSGEVGPSAAVAPEVSARASAEEAAAEAIACIEEGRFERARDLLDELLLSDRMVRARAQLAGGSPEDALLDIDRALAIAPENEEVRLLKADASLRLAEAKIQGGGGSASLIEGSLQDALEFYGGTSESAHALFGASRAAALLGQRAEALEFARRGMELLGADEAVPPELGRAPERIYAEQVYAAYASARADSSAEASALFLESEDALAKLLGRTSDDPWAWSTLSDLYEWEGRLADAKGAQERGLARAPEDAELLARLARVSGALEGAAKTVETFAAYAAAHPNVAAASWHLAVARFQLALSGFKQDPRQLDPAPFSAAEAEFRTTRERAPEFAQSALGYEVVCRLARGWCAFHAGDLALATREFLAMNELFERGIEWRLPGELESGIQGLFQVADAHAQADNLAAGEVFETLLGLQPDQYLWANNAGFFLRDAAVELERTGRAMCSAARGKLNNAEALAELRALAGIQSEAAGSAEERAAFQRAANERFERARGIMERSWRAYRPAAELAPEDVRVVNDSALVLVYYLHRDLEWAEQALMRCVAMGGPQLDAKKAALAAEATPERASALESEIELLTEAWGDAHQNLGVLEWVHRGNAEAARPWFEKSLEIWPTRPEVRNSYLPQVRGERAPDRDGALGWAKPCETP